MVTIKITKKFKRGLFEATAWKQAELVCGVDEVGRGCLSGPVVAAAAMLTGRAGHKYLKDSKLLTAEQRNKCFTWLRRRCIWGVGIVHSRIIDKINIHYATIKAMKRAIAQLFAIAHRKPRAILVDFVPLRLPGTPIPVYHFAKGEHHSSSVAAASIIAKVTRDNLMTHLNTVFPGYSWDKNKGYGTTFHRSGIVSDGLTLIHRKRFCSCY